MTTQSPQLAPIDALSLHGMTLRRGGSARRDTPEGNRWSNPWRWGPAAGSAALAVWALVASNSSLGGTVFEVTALALSSVIALTWAVFGTVRTAGQSAPIGMVAARDESDSDDDDADEDDSLFADTRPMSRLL